jgi:hypothetical protein
MNDRYLRLMGMLDFELLRAFVAVAECGGFHRAAERLNLTQSTVSQQIKRLEVETKRPLFRRTCCTLKKLPVCAWRRRGCPAQCVSVWSRRSPVARCLPPWVGSQRSIPV